MTIAELKPYVVTVAFNVEAVSDYAALRVVEKQLDQEDILLEKIIVVSVEELKEV